jgi:hypothetical protein
MMRFVVLALAIALSSARAGDAPVDEWSHYKQNPSLLLEAFALLKKNTESIIEIMSEQNIEEGRKDLEQILTRIPSSLIDPADDFGKFVDLRRDLQTALVARGIGQKLIESGELTAEVLNHALRVMPDEIDSQIQNVTVYSDPRTLLEWKKYFRELAADVSRNQTLNESALNPRLFAQINQVKISYGTWMATDYYKKLPLRIRSFKAVFLAIYIPATLTTTFYVGRIYWNHEGFIHLFWQDHDNVFNFMASTMFGMLPLPLLTGILVGGFRAYSSLMERIEKRMHGYHQPIDGFWRAIEREAKPGTFPETKPIEIKEAWLKGLLTGETKRADWKNSKPKPYKTYSGLPGRKWILKSKFPRRNLICRTIMKLMR